MKSKEEFKKFVIESLKDLSQEEQKVVIDGFMTAIQEALGEMGIGVVIKSGHVEAPSEMSDEMMKDFIDMLKGNDVDLENLGNLQDLKRNNKDDDGVKKIGDAVVVVGEISANYMHDFDTKEQLSKNFEKPLENFIGTPGIIIDTDTDFIFNCGHCPNEHESDLVVYFPSVDKKYHVHSRLVKVIG